MKSLHVVHVVRTLGHGGMELNMRRVILALSKDGMRHSLLHVTDNYPDRLTFPPHVTVNRFTAPARDPRVALRVWFELMKMRPTAIHVRNSGPWPDTALARIFLLPRTPLIFSYHGMEASEVSRRQRVKFQALSRLTSRLFAVSEAARRLLVDSYGLERKRVGVIENGVDTDRFSPGARPPGPRRLVVGAVGRLFKVKNVPLLLRASARLIERGLDLELRIAGDGPERDNVRALASSLNLGDRVRFLGHVKDVVPFLRELDVYALTSDSEANPNSLLEAMSAGCACVSSAVGNVPDLFDQERSGVLFTPGDEAGLADTLGALLGDEPRRRALESAARARIVGRFGEDRMFGRYEALYRDPLGAVLD
jgi:glycosyltransferase involved in cell wall biosynthesis